MRDKALLERVQHRFTSMIPGLKKLLYEKRLEHLKHGHSRKDKIVPIFWKFSGSITDCHLDTVSSRHLSCHHPWSLQRSL